MQSSYLSLLWSKLTWYGSGLVSMEIYSKYLEISHYGTKPSYSINHLKMTIVFYKVVSIYNKPSDHHSVWHKNKNVHSMLPIPWKVKFITYCAQGDYLWHGNFTIHLLILPNIGTLGRLHEYNSSVVICLLCLCWIYKIEHDNKL